jgi:GNAT superfamily N-acetyltransferase
MELRKDEYTITDKQDSADLDFIHSALNSTYWAEGRPKDVVQKSISNSVLLSLLYETEQVGFARIVSDYATFAWVCDVFIAPEHRGRELGKWLMSCVMQHPAADVTQVILATRDAHGLYEKFGFERREYMFVRKDP